MWDADCSGLACDISFVGRWTLCQHECQHVNTTWPLSPVAFDSGFLRLHQKFWTWNVSRTPACSIAEHDIFTLHSSNKSPNVANETISSIISGCDLIENPYLRIFLIIESENHSSHPQSRRNVNSSTWIIENTSSTIHEIANGYFMATAYSVVIRCLVGVLRWTQAIMWWDCRAIAYSIALKRDHNIVV